jgi:hypothetical protein
LPVDNGQAIRVFAIESGALTVEAAERSRGVIALVNGLAAQPVGTPDTTVAAAAGDRIVTDPEANYTVSNDGPDPAIVLVVIVSNTLEGDWPLNSVSAAASWTVAAMPEALGGVLPSPAGVFARVLVAGVEFELLEPSMLAFGWMYLAPGATFALPAGDEATVSAVVEGEVDLTVAGDREGAHLASGEWVAIPAGVGHLWQAGDNDRTSILMLTVG